MTEEKDNTIKYVAFAIAGFIGLMGWTLGNPTDVLGSILIALVFK